MKILFKYMKVVCVIKIVCQPDQKLMPVPHMAGILNSSISGVSARPTLVLGYHCGAVGLLGQCSRYPQIFTSFRSQPGNQNLALEIVLTHNHPRVLMSTSQKNSVKKSQQNFFMTNSFDFLHT